MRKQTLVLFAFYLSGVVSGSALYGKCLLSDECGTFDTYCRNGTCVCRDNFMDLFDSCIPTAEMKTPCKQKKECHGELGSRSICREGRCACRPFHHMHNGLCIKNKDLNDICDHDSQCYCGKECSEKIACIKNRCVCRGGFKPYSSRRCIDDPTFKLSHLQEERSSGSTRCKYNVIQYFVFFYIFIIR